MPEFRALLSDKLMRDFTGKVETAANMNVAMDMLADTVGLLGFGMVCYSYLPATRLPDGHWAPPPVLTRNYPPKWDAKWDRHSCNDPYYHSCFDGSLTVEWGAVQAREGLTRLERDTLAYLADKQLYREITIPIHLPAGRFAFVSALDNCGDAIWAKRLGESNDALFVISHYFHSVTFNKFKDPFPQDRPSKLSIRERECLAWAARGKTAEDIACILDRSVETVRIHLKRACAKLGAVNRVHAVAKACYLGLIELSD